MAKASTKANVTLSLTDKMSGSIKKISGKLKNIGVASTAMGTAIGASLGFAANKFASVGDQLEKMSAKTGFSAQALSELAFAAGQSGGSIESLDRALAGVARLSVDAGRGLSTATDNLNELGIAQSDFQSANPEDQFNMLTTALSGIEDPTKKAGLAMKVFGKSGRDLLPMLQNGPEGIAALREEAKALGITMSDEAAASAAALTDAIARLKTQISYVVISIGEALAPALVMMQQHISPLIAKVIAFVKENKRLVVTAGYVALALVTAGGALTALGILAPYIMAILGIMFNPWVIGIGLAVAALVGILKYFGLFDTVMGEVKATSDIIWEAMLVGYQGVVDAVKAGDLGLAFEVAMDSALYAVKAGLDRLFSPWRKYANEIVAVMQNAFKVITDLWSNGVDWIADKIIKVGMAVGLIDEATGKQMLIESAKIGEERVDRINTKVDAIALGVQKVINGSTEDAKQAMYDSAGRAKAAAEAASPKTKKVPKGDDIPTPKPLLQGTTGGSSAASVVSQLANDNIPKDQLAEAKKQTEEAKKQTDILDKIAGDRKPVLGA